MEPLITSLSNIGGLGLLSAVLLYLHYTSMKAFREELASERAICVETAQKERDQCRELHKETMESIGEVQKDVSFIRVKIADGLQQ